ncbi:MAG: hypothetical protein RLZZ585_546 [Bacteroidota bacterium]|jgi:hypothetical protein
MNQIISDIFQNKNKFISRNTGDELLLIPLKDNVVDFNQYLTLNDVAAFIWENLDSTDDLKSLSSKVCMEFDSNEDAIQEDIKSYLNELHHFMLIK